MSLSRAALSERDFLSRMFPTQSERAQRFTSVIANALRPEELPPGPTQIRGCTLSPRQEYVLKMLEDFVSTVIRLSNAQGWADWAHILWDLVRLRTGKSLFSSVEGIFGTCIQEIAAVFVEKQGFLTDTLQSFRECLDNVEMFEKSVLAEKVYKLFCFILAHGASSIANVPFLGTEMANIFSDYKDSRYSSKLGFVKCIVDFAVYFFEKLSAYKLTGSMRNAFFTENDVGEWYIETEELLRLSQNYSNLTPLGWDQYSFTVRLDDAVSKGEGYIKALKSSSKRDVIFVGKRLQAMKMVRENIISRAEASKFRDPPASFLLFGTSNIGKTLFMQNLISHMCKTMSWPIDDRQIYAFVPGVKHHDGCFDGKRIILMDELAPENPNKVMNVGDSSLGDVLKIVNTAPFILPTAALELKGKVTFRPQLVIGSTNVKHLNAEAYYQCPLAVRRRFPYVIELEMKPQYATSGMLDPAKVPPSVGYADIWNIHIIKIGAVVATDETLYEAGKHTVSETTVLRTGDSNVAYAFMSKVIVDHFENVAKARKAYEEGKTVEICRKVDADGNIRGCFMPTDKCVCVHMQADTVSEPDPELEEVPTQASTPDARVGFHMFTVPPQFRYSEWRNLGASLGGKTWNTAPHWKAMIMGTLPSIFWLAIVFVICPWYLWVCYGICSLLGLHLWLNPELSLPDDVQTMWPYGVVGWLLICQWFYLLPMTVGALTVIVVIWKCISNTLWRTTFLNFFTYVKMVRRDGFTAANRHMLFLSIRLVGKRVEESVLKLMPKDVVLCMAFFTAGFLLSRMLVKTTQVVKKVVLPKTEAPPSVPLNLSSILEEESNEEILDFSDDYVIQGGLEVEAIPDREPIQVTEAEPENVWIKHDFELTPLHLTPESKSFKALSVTEVLSKLRDNLFCLSVHRADLGDKWSRGKLFGLHENFFLTQKHFFTNGFPARCRAYKTGRPIRDDGIKDYQEFWIDRAQIVHEQEELLIVFLPQIRMVKTVLGLLSSQPLGGSHTAVLVRRQIEAKVADINVSRVLYGRYDIPDLNLGESDYAQWWGDTNSMDGDCGSPLVVFTHYGPVVYGFHIAGTSHGEPRGFAQRLDLGLLVKSLEAKGVKIKHSIKDACLPLAAESCPRTLEDLHFKSPVRYVLNGNAEVYGSLSGPRAAPKSNVGKTLMCDLMLSQGFEMKWGRPILHGWQPKRRVLLQATTSASQWRVPLLETVYEAFCRRFEKSLPRPQYAPLTLDEAINGVPGVRFLDAMPRKTSAGYPWNKSKLHFLIRSGDTVSLVPEMSRRVDMIELNALNGIITYPIFTASLKDEPLKLAKINDFATRVFYGSPMDYTIVCRKYLMPIVRFIQSNSQIFGAYPGVNCHSPQWEILARNLVAKHGYGRVASCEIVQSDARVNDGDYKMFDVSFEPELLYFALMTFVRIAEHIGYNPRDVLAVKTLVMGIFNGFVNFFGDLISPRGIVFSGSIITVLVNCFGNIFAVLYCFYKLRPRGCKYHFFEVVFIATYGDDNLMGFSAEVPWFNHVTLASELAKIGFTFTMADKLGVPVPYRTLKDVTFLKRRFRYDPDFGFIVAPIEEDSIIKSLMICVKSKSVTPADQMLSQVRSAAREYAYYGRETYEEKIAWLKENLRLLGLDYLIVRSTFPAFDSIVDDFKAGRLFGHTVLTSQE